jgi:hypothetical protein
VPNSQENGFCQVEVRPGWVAPSAVVGSLSPVGWAEVGRRHTYCSGNTPGRSGAHELVTGSAHCSVVEQCRTQCGSGCPVACSVQVPISASSTCTGLSAYVSNEQTDPEFRNKLTAEDPLQILSKISRTNYRRSVNQRGGKPSIPIVPEASAPP